MTPSIGAHKQLVSLRREQRVDDGRGGYTNVPVEYAQAWVHIQPVSAGQRQYGGYPVSDATHRIHVRYDPGVHGNDIISLLPEGTQEWNVLAVQKTPGHVQVELVVREVVKSR